MRTMLTATASRHLHSSHPRQVNALAKLTSLQNAVNCVPGRDQKKSNTLGDSYGKKESLRIMERACDGFDAPVLEMKQAIESIYLNGLYSSARAKAAAARRLGIRGFGFFADNVDLVSQFAI